MKFNNSGSCYKLLSDQTNWYTARSACSSLESNSELASIITCEENEFVKGKIISPYITLIII